MSIVKDLLFIIIFVLFVFLLKRNFSLKSELFAQRENFIKTLSHDLRVSTLAQIRGLNILQKQYQGEELLNDLDESCKYSLDMINILLNTYRYENGEQVLNYETFNFSEIISPCTEKLLKTMKEKGVEFCFSISDSDTVTADKTEIGKTLFYLLSTSVYYSNKNNKIFVFIKKLHDKFEISITYSGKPLSEEECRRMFLNNPRFSTVGHGIKMYLCKKIIEFHGGNIFVNNCGGNFNSFTFTLPRIKLSSKVKCPCLSKLQPFHL